MNVKEYLLNGSVNLAELAAELYPKNKTARIYLYKKLNNKDGRTFTKKDSEKVLDILRKRCESISALTVE